MTRTLTPSGRIAALQCIDADLAWLVTPHRPPCPVCDGACRVADRPCGRCDGIGSLDPPERTSPLGKARQVLLDAELQSAIIRAQRPEGASKPTEGSTAWSDPTGDLAVSEAAVELRAGEILRNWFAGVEIVHECIRDLTDIVRDQLGEAPGRRELTAAQTFASLHWLLVIPHNRLTVALKGAPESVVAEVDHAICTAAEAAAAVVRGRPAYRGKLSPSVNGVLEAARKVTTTAPPKPKQAERVRCRNCWRWEIDQDCAAGSTSLCSRCIEFRKALTVMPTEAICRHWHNGRRGVPPAMLLEAKAQGTAKRKRSA